VLFLSSIDDPQPLACLEALALGKRVVAYSGTGTAEIVENIPGCRVFSKYEAPSAIDAINSALHDQEDLVAIRSRLNEIAGIDSFAHRIDMAFSPC
jgi:glycosyltransferase involved in cell wall biosynthesis